MLRFHLDEHVSRAIANGLRRRQIDVTTTADAGLLGADDEDHASFALREGRVIFTKTAIFFVLPPVESSTPVLSTARRRRAISDT